MNDNERRTRVVAYRVELVCHQSGCKGTLHSTGHAFTQLSTSFEHRCGTCGKTTWLDTAYPYIDYQEEAREVPDIPLTSTLGRY